MLKNRSASQSMAELCYAYISPQMQLSKYNPCFNCFWFRTIVRYRSGNKSIDLPHLLKGICLLACTTEHPELVLLQREKDQPGLPKSSKQKPA